MRTVKVSTPQSDRLKSIEVDNDVETWGELKEVLIDNDINVTEMIATVRETKVTLQATGAQLPEGDFTLFLFTEKIKSGVTDTRALLEAMQEKFNAVFDELITDLEDGTISSTDVDDDFEEELTEREQLERELNQ